MVRGLRRPDVFTARLNYQVANCPQAPKPHHELRVWWENWNSCCVFVWNVELQSFRLVWLFTQACSDFNDSSAFWSPWHEVVFIGMMGMSRKMSVFICPVLGPKKKKYISRWESMTAGVNPGWKCCRLVKLLRSSTMHKIIIWYNEAARFKTWPVPRKSLEYWCEQWISMKPAELCTFSLLLK